MTNYEKALKLEEEYLALRTKPEEKNTFKLHKKLENLGFTLESFQEEKCNRFFEGKNIQIKLTNEDDVMPSIISSVNEEKEVVIICEGKRPIVWVPVDKSLYDAQYCENNNICVINMNHNGGVIVSSNQDSDVGFIIKNSENMPKNILKRFNQFYQSKGCNSEIVGNDILIDGFKVTGTGSRNFGNGFYIHCFQITINVETDLIKNICTKPMNKIPKGLNEFSNISRQDIINEVNKWLL